MSLIFRPPVSITDRPSSRFDAAVARLLWQRRTLLSPDGHWLTAAEYFAASHWIPNRMVPVSLTDLTEPAGPATTLEEAVARGERRVLLVAPGGTGKTTRLLQFAHACLGSEDSLPFSLSFIGWTCSAAPFTVTSRPLVLEQLKVEPGDHACQRC